MLVIDCLYASLYSLEQMSFEITVTLDCWLEISIVLSLGW